MGWEEIVKLASQYGLYGALLVYMIITFTKLTNRMMDVIDRNSKAIGAVTQVIEKCKKKEEEE